MFINDTIIEINYALRIAITSFALLIFSSILKNLIVHAIIDFHSACNAGVKKESRHEVYNYALLK